MAENEQNIAAEDPRSDDDASSISGQSTDESTASLRSTILDYRRENGRTYHRLSDGKYAFPNDDREQDRLDLTHHLWLLTWDNELCNSPKKNGAKRVLDIGTGTGIWALDYGKLFIKAILQWLTPQQRKIIPKLRSSASTSAQSNPACQLSFTILAAVTELTDVVSVPPNCGFEVDDVEKEWTWREPFDFIFIRHMMASFSDWPEIFAKAYKSLEPGGYIELQDHQLPLKCDDGTMTDDFKPYKWTNMLIEATNKIGRPIDVPRTYKAMLEEAGFVDVEVKVAKWPFNEWPKDQKLKDLGYWTQETALAGIEAATMALFTRVLDWTSEEATVFCAEIRNAHKTKAVHAYYDVYGVWARKPEEKEKK